MGEYGISGQGNGDVCRVVPGARAHASQPAYLNLPSNCKTHHTRTQSHSRLGGVPPQGWEEVWGLAGEEEGKERGGRRWRVETGWKPQERETGGWERGGPGSNRAPRTDERGGCGTGTRATYVALAAY